MKQSGFRLGGRGVLMLAIAAAYPTAAQSAPAARVEFAIGNPTAQGPAGTVRPLTKGVEVTTGDMIDTRDGRVQLRFVDGAYVSLQPQSQFRIDDFRYNGKQDGTEKGFFSLVKGGLRTITGLVGRNNKNAYLVTTSVATIGIRGTEYTIQYGKSVSGSVGEGEIKVCNGGGCLNVNNGESYYVQSPDVKPQLTDKKVDLPPQQPQSTPATFVQAENRSATGDPISFILTGPQTVHFAYVEGSFPPGPVPNTAAVFDETGALRQADFGGTVKYWSGPVYDQGNDGIIAWSRWTGDFVRDAAGNPLTDLQTRSLHNVAGLPTSASDLSQLNLAQLKGTYELAGSTTPTWSSGGVAGSLSGASLVANFGSMQVTGSVAVNVGGTVYAGTTLGSISSMGSTFTGFGGSSAGALNFSGFFAGTNAMRAGMAYDLWVPGGQVQGAAAFTQTGLTNPSGATVPPP